MIIFDFMCTFACLPVAPLTACFASLFRRGCLPLRSRESRWMMDFHGYKLKLQLPDGWELAHFGCQERGVPMVGSATLD